MGDMTPGEMRPKYNNALIMLYLGVPVTWEADGSRGRLLLKIQELFRADSEIGTGDGGETLLTIMVEAGDPREFKTKMERLRYEYPLVGRHKLVGDDGSVRWLPAADENPAEYS